MSTEAERLLVEFTKHVERLDRQLSALQRAHEQRSEAEGPNGTVSETEWAILHHRSDFDGDLPLGAVDQAPDDTISPAEFDRFR